MGVRRSSVMKRMARELEVLTDCEAALEAVIHSLHARTAETQDHRLRCIIDLLRITRDDIQGEYDQQHRYEAERQGLDG